MTGFIGNPAINFLPGAAVGVNSPKVGLRPEHIQLIPAAGAALSGTVRLVERLGNLTLVHVATPAGMVSVQGSGRLSAKVGETFGLSLDASHALHFDETGRRRL